MGRPKKIKLEDLKGMSLANGKIWDENNLEKKLGYKSQYQNLSLNEYEQEIKNMPILELQEHATEVLVPVKNNRELLIANLIKEFRIRKN